MVTTQKNISILNISSEIIKSMNPYIPLKPINTTDIRISKIKLIAILFAIIGFLLSFNLSQYYIKSDQKFYRLLYDEILNYPNLESKFSFYQSITNASEPAYFIFTIITSTFFDKDFIYAIVNGSLLCSAALILLKRNINPIILLLLITNYYFMTLFFSAERLKVAIFIFLLAFIINPKYKWKLIILSSLFHYQMVIAVFCLIIWEFKYYTNKNKVLILVLSLIIIATIWYSNTLEINPILTKISIYSESKKDSLYGIIKPSFFSFFAIYFCKEKTRTFLAITPLILTSFFLGSERITLFSYAIMMYFGAHKNRGINAPIIISSLYFFFGGLDFISVFLEHGSVGDVEVENEN